MPPHLVIGIESWCVGKLLRIFFVNQHEQKTSAELGRGMDLPNLLQGS